MREDPIVFEDWKIGTIEIGRIRVKLLFNHFLTLVFCIIQLIAGIIARNGTIIFTWVFMYLISIVLEVFFDQIQRTLNNQVIFTYILILTGVLITPRALLSKTNIFNIMTMVAGGIMMGKLIFIYLINLELSLSQEILEPRSEYAKSILKEQVLRVQDTEFELENKADIETSIKPFVKPYLYNYGLIGTIIIAVVIVNVVFDVLFAFTLATSFLASVIMLSLVFAWYRIKRDLKTSIDEKKEEVIPVFAQAVEE